MSKVSDFKAVHPDVGLPPGATSPRPVLFVCGFFAVCLVLILVRHEMTRGVSQARQAAASIPLPPASVVALGSIVPGNAVIHLNAPASSGEARLQHLFVRVNDSVSANQIVGTLDSIDRLEAAVEVSRAQVAAKQAALDKVIAGNSSYQIAAQQATVERLRVEATRQASEIQRYRALHEQGIISDSDWDLRSVAFTQATASLHEGESTLNQSSEVRPVDVSIARADLLSEKAGLRSAESNLEQGYIRAPERGRVLHIYTWPGERVGDQGVLEMAPLNDMFAEAEVYETDISRIRLGQAATVTATALSRPLHGEVLSVERSIGRQQVVNTDPAANTDARVAIVRVRLDAPSKEAAERLINLQVRVEFQP